MPLLLFTGQGPFANPQEIEALVRLSQSLTTRFAEFPQPWYLVFNVEVRQYKLDYLFLAPGTIAILEMKAASQPFLATANGPWNFKNPDGTKSRSSVSGGSALSPYVQVEAQRFKLLDWLKEYSSGFLPALTTRPLFLPLAAVVISPSIHSDSEQEPELAKRTWFRLLGQPELPAWLEFTAAAQSMPWLTDEVLQRMVTLLRVWPWDAVALAQARLAMPAEVSRGNFMPTRRFSWPSGTGQPIRTLIVVGAADELFGNSSSVDAFAPSLDEFATGRVHRPAVADAVEAALARDGWSLVRGYGAAGKTTLAFLLSATGEFEETYYIDLARSEYGNAYRELVSAATSKALLIVDNVHADETLARQLFDAWQQLRSGMSGEAGPRLLLLGTAISPDYYRGVASPLAELEVAAVSLHVSTDDLAGVLQRLLLRRTRRPPVPPKDAVFEWLLFSGDLIAFSAAVAARIENLLAGDWKLHAADAEHYVKKTYLDPLSPEQRSELLKLAVLGELEIATGLGLVEPRLLSPAIRLGVVQRFRTRPDAHVRFRLINRGMASLLLAAAGLSHETRRRMQAELARRDPAIAGRLAERFEALGESALACEILQPLASDMSRVADMLSRDGLERFSANVERILKLPDIPPTYLAELDQSLAAREELFVSLLAVTEAQSVAGFGLYCATRLPTFHRELWRTAHERDDVISQLVERFIASGYTFQIALLRYANFHDEPLLARLRSALVAEENVGLVVEATLQSGQGLRDYLRCLSAVDPAAYERLSIELGRVHLRERLASVLSSLGAHDLARLLAFFRVDDKSHALLAACSAALEEEAALPTLNRLVRNSYAVAAGELICVLKEVAPNLRLPVDLNAMAPRERARQDRPSRARTARPLLQYPRPMEPWSWGEWSEWRPAAWLPADVLRNARAVADERQRQAVLAALLEQPFETVGPFLQSIREAAPESADTVTAMLCEPSALQRLKRSIVVSPFGTTAGVLGSIARNAAMLAHEIEGSVLSMDVIGVLAKGACTASLDSLTQFLVAYGSVGRSLLGAIDEESWIRGWADRPRASVERFPTFDGLALKHGRPGLARVVAERFVQAPEISGWTAQVGLGHVSRLLRAAKDLPERQRARFLHLVGSNGWLATRLDTEYPRPLAAALFSLATYNFDVVGGVVETEELRPRILGAMREPPPGDSDALSGALRLLGASSLYGVHPNQPAPEWKSDAFRESVRHLSLLVEPPALLTSAEVQLWLGIRELEGATGEAILDGRSAEAILARLALAEPPTARHAEINRLLETWLRTHPNSRGI